MSPLLTAYSQVVEAVPCTTCLVTNVFYTAPVATAGLTARLRGSVKQMAPGLVKNRTAKVREVTRMGNTFTTCFQKTHIQLSPESQNVVSRLEVVAGLARIPFFLVWSLTARYRKVAQGQRMITFLMRVTSE